MLLPRRLVKHFNQRPWKLLLGLELYECIIFDSPILELLLKQVLKSAQSNRELEGVLYETFLGPQCDLVNAMQEQNKIYSDQAAIGGKGHGLGPPHVYSFAALLSAQGKLGDTVGAQTASEIQQATASVQGQTWQENAQWIKFCRVTKTYKAEVVRITL